MFSLFWQQFEACVDCQNVATVSKFSYLISALRGEAKNLLDELPVVQQNYEEARRLLKKRYRIKEAKLSPQNNSLLTSDCAIKQW